MKNIDKEIKELEQSLPDVCTDVYDYSEEYITDIISTIADDKVDIYYSELLNWIDDNRTEAVSYIEDAVAEFGIDSKNFNFWKLLQQGQYYMHEQELYENKKDMLLLWALNYIKDKKGLAEIEEDDFDAIEDLDFDKFDKFSELEFEIDNILDKGE